jgi:hypothetical protein
MADAEAEGIREAGIEADMYQYVPIPVRVPLFNGRYPIDTSPSIPFILSRQFHPNP